MTAPNADPTPALRGLWPFLTAHDTVEQEMGETIDRLDECGAMGGLIWIEAPDGRKCSPIRASMVADLMRSRGLEVGLWTMPRAGDVSGAVQRLAACVAATQPMHVSLNVERPPRSTNRTVVTEWTWQAASRLYAGAIDSIHEGTSLSLSSYPIRSHFDHWIPWAHAPTPIGMPELYRTADQPHLYERAISEWRSAHETVVPIFDSFLGAPDRLDRVLHLYGHEWPALALWSLQTTDRAERRVLRAYAVERGWLPPHALH